MEWPPPPMLLFTSWLMGQMSDEEFGALMKLYREKHKRDVESAEKLNNP